MAVPILLPWNRDHSLGCRYHIADALRSSLNNIELQELPRRISTDEEREILSLLCKVHELEIEKVEMQSEAVLKEHEVKRRDLLILKYDKQRALTDEIIQRQRKLIEGER